MGVQSISPLADIRLRRLEIYGASQLRDLNPLRGSLALDYLSLFFAGVQDLAPLAGLVNMYELNLAGCPVRDVKPLVGMCEMRRLNLLKCQAPDYSVLNKFTQLERLVLSHSTITRWPELCCCSALSVFVYF